jgi:hypothetical protein
VAFLCPTIIGGRYEAPGYPLGALGTVPRTYENEELHVWCTSFLIYMKQRMTK